MIEQKLRAIVPDEVNEFEKLSGGDPYCFNHWGKDRNGMACMYYWFYSKDKAKKNQKRIIIVEIENLLKALYLNQVDMINRNMFYKLCPKSYSDGSGYVVTIKSLEALKIVEYAGTVGARIINKEKVKGLIGDVNTTHLHQYPSELTWRLLEGFIKEKVYQSISWKLVSVMSHNSRNISSEL